MAKSGNIPGDTIILAETPNQLQCALDAMSKYCELYRLQGAGLIDGYHTDVVCSDFGNYLFICLSQYEKLGHLVSVSRDIALKEEDPGTPTFTTKVLLGNDEPVNHVMARALAAKIPTQKPILFALALRESTPQTLKALHELLHKHSNW